MSRWTMTTQKPSGTFLAVFFGTTFVVIAGVFAFVSWLASSVANTSPPVPPGYEAFADDHFG